MQSISKKPTSSYHLKLPKLKFHCSFKSRNKIQPSFIHRLLRILKAYRFDFTDADALIWKKVLAQLQTKTYKPQRIVIFSENDVKGHLVLWPSLLPPGTGCLLQAVETAAQCQAQTVGKPNHFMFDCVASKFGVDRERCLMVGDRLDTDIMLGSNCGLKTLLTLTGVSTLADADAHQKSGCVERQGMVPDYYVESIADFLPALQGWDCQSV